MHMPRQLSCRVMHRIMTCSFHYLSRNGNISLQDLHGLYSLSRWTSYRSYSWTPETPWDWMLWLSYRSEIWQASRQRCCRNACQISELLEKSKPESRGTRFCGKTSVRLVNRSPDAGGGNSTSQEKYTSFHFVWPVTLQIRRQILHVSIWYSRVISPKWMIPYVFKIFLHQHVELWNTGQTEAFEDTAILRVNIAYTINHFAVPSKQRLNLWGKMYGEALFKYLERRYSLVYHFITIASIIITIITIIISDSF